MDRGKRPVDASRADPAREVVEPRWEALRESPEFRRLMRTKRNFVIPAMAFFLVYYFALPLSNGLAPGLMKTKIVGSINLAYLFALSEFIMAWVVAYLYITRANRIFDPLAAAVRRLAGRERVV